MILTYFTEKLEATGGRQIYMLWYEKVWKFAPSLVFKFLAYLSYSHVSGHQANFNIKQGWPEKRQYIVFKWWLHLLGTYLFLCEKVIAPKNNNWLYQLLQLKTAIKHFRYLAVSLSHCSSHSSLQSCFKGWFERSCQNITTRFKSVLCSYLIVLRSLQNLYFVFIWPFTVNGKW